MTEGHTTIVILDHGMMYVFAIESHSLSIQRQLACVHLRWDFNPLMQILGT